MKNSLHSFQRPLGGWRFLQSCSSPGCNLFTLLCPVRHWKQIGCICHFPKCQTLHSHITVWPSQMTSISVEITWKSNLRLTRVAVEYEPQSVTLLLMGSIMMCLLFNLGHEIRYDGLPTFLIPFPFAVLLGCKGEAQLWPPWVYVGFVTNMNSDVSFYLFLFCPITDYSKRFITGPDDTRSGLKNKHCKLVQVCSEVNPTEFNSRYGSA